MRKKKVRKVRFTKGEKLLYFVAIICACLTITLKIFCGAGIGNLSMSVEKSRYEIADQEKKNESLTMKVNELTSFDNVKKVVKDIGLAYNYDSIIVINE